MPIRYCCDKLREMLEYQQTPDNPTVQIHGGRREAVRGLRKTVPVYREYRLKFCPFCRAPIHALTRDKRRRPHTQRAANGQYAKAIKR